MTSGIVRGWGRGRDQLGRFAIKQSVRSASDRRRAPGSYAVLRRAGLYFPRACFRRLFLSPRRQTAANHKRRDYGGNDCQLQIVGHAHYSRLQHSRGQLARTREGKP